MPFHGESRIIRQLTGEKPIGSIQQSLVEEDSIDIEVEGVSEDLIEQIDQIAAGEKDLLPGMPLPSLSIFENQNQLVHRSFDAAVTLLPDLI